MARLVEAGLTHVYMGVENGDEQGLIHLNKMLKPHHHIEAGEILRALGVSFDFGFMLLEPWSTILVRPQQHRFPRPVSSATAGRWPVSAGPCPTPARQ